MHIGKLKLEDLDKLPKNHPDRIAAAIYLEQMVANSPLLAVTQRRDHLRVIVGNTRLISRWTGLGRV